MTDQPRQYAVKIIKRVLEKVNEMLEELNCQEHLRDLVKTHVYNGLSAGWARRRNEEDL